MGKGKQSKAKRKLERVQAPAQLDPVRKLEAEHKEVEALFEAFALNTESDRRFEIAQEIFAALERHAHYEEQVFYPACRSVMKRASPIARAYVEHALMHFLIERLRMQDPAHEQWSAGVEVLEAMVRRHVKREQRDILRRARKAELRIETPVKARVKAKKRKTTV